ncbi:hypothetical protein ABG866_20290 [Phocaeicola vulgatus]|jgi:hypothetical protein|nr:hypothetical protein [Phocaeicola vulgatus]KAB5446367.1 hypothetical protein F9001_19285 [Phocaeicola vulgatus]MDB0978821.1 hypothetical protein [Phocaeicola vulgatus]
MSDLNLENIVGFKAVDKNGNERQVTVDEMTELVSARIVSAASEISTFAAAAAAGTDEFEDQLPQSDTFSWLRTLDGSKNPTLTSSSAAAKVLGELIGVATAKKDGLMPMEQFFDRDVNPIEDYNTFTWNGIRKTTKSTSNSPFESGDGQNAVIFIGTNDVQKIGFQATYSGQLIKIRLYWVGSWGKWQTFSLT